jgi:hypothetical protein
MTAHGRMQRLPDIGPLTALSHFSDLGHLVVTGNTRP